MRHYELILFYASGFSPSDCIKDFGYSRSSAYRFHSIYRKARKTFVQVVKCRNSVPLGERRRTNNLGSLKQKKRVPPKEKWEMQLRDNGVVVSRRTSR